MENYSLITRYKRIYIYIYIICVYDISVMRAHTKLKVQQARSLIADSVKQRISLGLKLRSWTTRRVRNVYIMNSDTTATRLEWPGITEQGKKIIKPLLTFGMYKMPFAKTWPDFPCLLSKLPNLIAIQGMSASPELIHYNIALTEWDTLQFGPLCHLI